MEKKEKHSKKKRFTKKKSKHLESETPLTKKSDEDGLLIFQYEVTKLPWIFRKIKTLFESPVEPLSEKHGGLKA